MAESKSTARRPCLVLAGGGTGGHLYPALAVAQALVAADPAWQVAFVGTARGLEARVLPPLGLDLHLLPVLPLRGRTPRETLLGLATLPRAGQEAFALMRRLKPTLVLGVGGYAAGPAVLAAWAQRTPTWLLEANASAGLTNRLLARVAQRILLGTPNAAMSATGRSTLVGYPVRESLARVGERPFEVPEAFSAERPLCLLVMGGSQGARALNRMMPQMVAELARQQLPVRIVHQSGPKDLQATKDAYRAAGVDDRGVVGYIDAMDEALSTAHLVVCRAGASTLAELGVVGRPALLVPYPFAADDHQTANARQWVSARAAELIVESELDAQDVARRIGALVRAPQQLAERARAAKRLGRPRALAEIVAAIRALGPSRAAHV